ncbi:uncharacterized protein A1O9_09655 [Exophiala aquamarina CBS 119918]|uniref:Zn(2)-C6 fungal-type domain-containing protein n=1 Tax=Exophiala aquamarina CBS 119918 TaxID=1182545 RepID=A0A072P5B9_9EURO|nr:uncharacterized protein A1O9_09655 [Exophiala aquamarina CBS 119918]KEF54488.1 hypothetical protein A1O9_09655 [Exophiala aquamarina CBS 119918]
MDNEQDVPATKPRVFQACGPCGMRKTKCDGNTPFCKVCVTRGRECFYSGPRRDKRKRTEDPDATTETPTNHHTTVSIPSSTEQSRSPTTLQTRSATLFRFRTSQGEENTRSSPSTVTINRTVPSYEPSPQQRPPELDVSLEVAAYLFAVYFNVIHPVWPILYKPLFDSTDFNGIVQSMSKSLLYAICALAACVTEDNSKAPSSRPGLIPKPWAFYKAAMLAQQIEGTPDKNDLDRLRPFQLLRSSVASCQTFTILALQLRALGESAHAYTIFSRAAAMAFNLNLHKQSPLETDSTEVQVRSRLWSNMYILDKMLACELGRPVLLPLDYSLPDPFSPMESDEYQLLKMKIGSDELVSVKAYTVSGLSMTMQLSEILEPVLRKVYSFRGRKFTKENLEYAGSLRTQVWENLKRYDEKFKEWMNSLNQQSTSQPVPTPASVTCLVWFWTVTIMLHRPFYHHWSAHTDLEDDPESKENHPREVCRNAASQICEIVEDLVPDLSRYPCNLLFPIFIAGSTLSHYITFLKEENRVQEATPNEELRDKCVIWLSIIGRNIEAAGDFDARMISDPNYSSTSERATKPHEPSAQASILHSTAATAKTGDTEPSARSSGPRHPAPSLQQSTAPASTYNWDFLNSLGDSTDALYAWDEEFKKGLREGTISITAGW